MSENNKYYKTNLKKGDHVEVLTYYHHCNKLGFGSWTCISGTFSHLENELAVIFIKNETKPLKINFSRVRKCERKHEE